MRATSLPISFDFLPVWQVIVLYILVSVPVLWLGSRSMAGLRSFQKWASIGIRLDLLMLIIMVLAGAQRNQRVKDLTVVVVRDVSRSTGNMKSTNAGGISSDIERFVADQAITKPSGDRIGEISFDGRARIDSLPTYTWGHAVPAARQPVDGTDIAQGLQLAMATMPTDALRRLVLISDGNATSGDLDQAVASAASQRIPVDVVPLRYRIEHHVSIERLIAPSSRRQDAPFDLDLVLRSANTEPIRARLLITDNGKPLVLGRGAATFELTRDIELEPGVNVEHVLVPPRAAGVHDFRASIEIVNSKTANAIPQNDSAEAMTLVLGKSRVLYVEGPHADPSQPLCQTLLHKGLVVDVVDPSSMPRTLVALLKYDTIILNNVPNGPDGIDAAQQNLLKIYVNDMGGGLVVVGGPDSFGPGGWIGSSLEKLLPVDCEPPARRVMPAGALTLVIDDSGSMEETLGSAGQTKEQAADESAVLALKALSSGDRIGVIAFDSSPRWVVPLQLNRDPDSTAKAIRGIAPTGGTQIYPALEAADEAMSRLSPQSDPIRHVLLLTDGQSAGGDFDRLIVRMKTQGISLSTVGVGNDIDEPLLRRFAQLGSGRFYRVADSKTLPQIFVKEAMTLRSTLIREEPFTPQLRAGEHSMVAGIDTLPQLLGMVRTWPKANPGVEVPIASDNGEPILASWRVGLGQVIAFTSDANRRWATNWIATPIFEKLWDQVVRAVARNPMSDGAEARIVSTPSGRPKLTVELSDSVNAVQSGHGVSAEIFGPNSAQIGELVEMRQTGARTYEGDFSSPVPGAYLAIVTVSGDALRPNWTAATYAVNRSPEDRDLESNEALLRSVAARTGGRLIELPDRHANFFDRTDLSPQMASTPLTDRLLVWSMVLLIVDVGVRRIAWDRRSIVGRAEVAANYLRTFTQVKTSDAQVAVFALRNLRRDQILDRPVISTMTATNTCESKAEARNPNDSESKIGSEELGAERLDLFQRLAAAKQRARTESSTNSADM